MRDQFDLTPQQYHAGVDKLWSALGISGPQDTDVFTLAAQQIVHGKQIAQEFDRLKRANVCLARIAWNQAQWGALGKVLLYPCDCGRLTVDEWYPQPGCNLHKEQSVVVVASVDEARDIYRGVFGELRESYYIPGRGTYTSFSERDNFIVTGSHCFCGRCRSE